MGEGKQLTNLRFADDILLISSSADSLEEMLTDLADGAGKVGLRIHYGKTKLLCNRVARETGRRMQVKVHGQTVPVLLEGETVKYLGRALRLDAPDDAEIEIRITSAWRKFMALRKELRNRHMLLMQRMKLFGATVSATLPY